MTRGATIGAVLWVARVVLVLSRLGRSRPALGLALPSVARKQGDQFPLDLLDSGRDVERDAWWKQPRDVLREGGLAGLAGEILLEESPRDVVPVALHVGPEDLDDGGGIDPGLERDAQIEEVASLLSLEERPELGPEELLDRVRRDVRAAAPPA